ncbi:ABC transporter ATP-binding protein [Brevibacillus fluminis]|uniref:ABC transporter ATP-binding protein n=1 Tax=Brevibacillus fluminis TaxID=511487 RepID=A0A3M8DHZ7_9BACL|nr:ABC transporter ATP-binding protein [Brevibacillus fluminis]
MKNRFSKQEVANIKALLDISHLSVDFKTKTGLLRAITDVSLAIEPGETVCLVGESGSGKTITSKAVMRLIDYENGVIAGGNIWLGDIDLTALTQEEVSRLRGKKIAMVFQEPMAAFDPVFTIGKQIVEVIVRHKQATRTQAKERAVYLLQRVGIPEPHIRMNQYPGELSGGMLQRAMIAMALACGPELLIADEPTTALDVTIQSQILHLLQELKSEFNMAILLITHDMGIAAEIADRIVVMYAGQIVEQATVYQLFAQPHHPYTRGLLRSIPKLAGNRQEKLYSITGSIPSLSALPTGCRFHPRCPHATQQCVDSSPPLHEVNQRQVACWHAEELAKADTGDETTGRQTATAHATVLEHDLALVDEVRRETLFDIKEVSKFYPIRQGALKRTTGMIRAVDNVSFTIGKGETFGLVGESGSGKSTLGRVLLQLERATAGKVLFQGHDLTQQQIKRLRESRRHMQMIFQDPYNSLDPRWSIGDIIGEPLWIHDGLRGKEKQERVEQLLAQVGLSPSWYDRFPHEFSGGQRQRIGIARAIATNPQFVLADEAVSALDVSVQSQIVNLLQDLQSRLGLTYLFIGHGLSIVRHISTRIGVMYLGKLVEIAPSEELFANAAHHYTKALLASIPSTDPTKRRGGVTIQGEIPSPANPPSGCRFHTRCPAATARCREQAPQLDEVRSDHWVACHHPV